MHTHSNKPAKSSQSPPAQKPIPAANGYDSLAVSLLDSGHWFPIYEPLLAVLDPAEAVMLHKLIAAGRAAKEKRELSPDGFFWCNEQFLANAYWPRRRQQIVIDRLIQKGLIEKKVVGIPATRWVRVNGDVVDDLITSIPPANQPRRISARVCAKSVQLDARPACTNNTAAAQQKRITIPRVAPRRRGTRSRPSQEPEAAMSSSPSTALVPDEESSPSEAHAWAQELQDALNGSAQPTRAGIAAGAAHMKALVRRVGAERVRRVLDWYVANAKSIAKPKVYNVRNFCRQGWLFDKLERLARGNRPPVASRNVQLSKELEHLYKVCKLHRHWPNVTDDALKSFLQQTHDNAAALRKRLKELAPTNRFAAHMLGKYLSRPLSLTEFWDEHVNGRLKGWDTFSGNLSPFVFHVGHKDFDAMARSWAAQWGLASKADKVWNELKEELSDGGV